MKIVLIGHGHTAEAMKGAVEMIFGKVPDFYPVAFTKRRVAGFNQEVRRCHYKF